MKTLPLKATTPAEKLLINYKNCITLLQYTTAEQPRKELQQTIKELESRLLEALER